jgi:hypothetical protein
MDKEMQELDGEPDEQQQDDGADGNPQQQQKAGKRKQPARKATSSKAAAGVAAAMQAPAVTKARSKGGQKGLASVSVDRRSGVCQYQVRKEALAGCAGWCHQVTGCA